MDTNTEGSVTRRMEKEKADIEMHERLEYAYSTLHYNQNLIQFAEAKANSLLLINSILLATATAIMQQGQTHHLWQIFNVIKISFLVISAISVIICLIVVIPSKEDPSRIRKRDHIFFADILSYKSAENYIFEFNRARTNNLLEDLLNRCYNVAQIASLKFSRYSVAQSVTFISCVLWLACTIMYYLI